MRRHSAAADSATLAVVVIGRNEGARLDRCLDSVVPTGAPVIYVDSGSSDGSAARAAERGVHVVELDPSVSFTAARARNAGMAFARESFPSLRVVQFVDGDCELVPGWLERGAGEAEAHPRTGVICGRVRERDHATSTYRLLCDLEWRSHRQAGACGGNAMLRVDAFVQTGGFDPRLIAGEEPELSVRLRANGWEIRHVDADMVVHDSGMTRFTHWWRRTLRGGWAYAEAAMVHAGGARRAALRANASIAFWGTLLPSSALALALPTAGASLVLLGAYPWLVARIYRRGRRLGLSGHEASVQALFTVLGKFPQALGQAEFVARRILRKRRGVVEWRVVR